MTVVLILLLINGALGAFDTLWYHEYIGRLTWHPQRHRRELLLHASRDAVYVVLYGSLGWIGWLGAWAWVLSVLLAAEIVITLADFVVEDRTRSLRPGERVLHSMMAIIYGIVLANLVPLIIEWARMETRLASYAEPLPRALTVAATLGGIGIAISGGRDLIACLGPDIPQGPANPRSAMRVNRIPGGHRHGWANPQSSRAVAPASRSASLGAPRTATRTVRPSRVAEPIRQ